MIEAIVLMVIQKEQVKNEVGFRLYAILAWPTLTFVYAAVLYFLRRRSSFTTAFIHVFGIVVGGGSFRNERKLEKLFILFISIVSLLFNAIFTGYLFTEYTKVIGRSRFTSAQEFLDSNTTIYHLESLWPNIIFISDMTW